MSEGLDELTAKRVAQTSGVVPVLVDQHFKSADELVAAAVGHTATADDDTLFTHAERADHPVDRIRQSMQAWLHQDRDPVRPVAGCLDDHVASVRREGTGAGPSRDPSH
ncbi:hypothetical protein WDA79_04720 [Streptomyces sp. A475]|uniref:hypothetical protein n=1 Tax=Streptomyces sp. A475 TaxID=3131976 RepID=UPI0030CA09A6